MKLSSPEKEPMLRAVTNMWRLPLYAERFRLVCVSSSHEACPALFSDSPIADRSVLDAFAPFSTERNT